MKRCIFFRLSLCALLLLVSASVPAKADFYIGVRGGLSNENVSTGSIKFDKDSSFLCGGQIGFKFHSFALEGEFYRASHTLSYKTPLLFIHVPQDITYYFLGISGKLGIPLSIVYPYLTVGYGTYNVDLKNIGRKSDMSFNVGAGAELSIGKVGIFAEIRYSDFSIDFTNQKWDFGGLDLHAGINIHF
jgi:opacity protein-like surface antigen